MLSRRLLATRPLTRPLRTPLPFRAFSRTALLRADPDVEDPGMVSFEPDNVRDIESGNL